MFRARCNVEIILHRHSRKMWSLAPQVTQMWAAMAVMALEWGKLQERKDRGLNRDVCLPGT